MIKITKVQGDYISKYYFLISYKFVYIFTISKYFNILEHSYLIHLTLLKSIWSDFPRIFSALLTPWASHIKLLCY